MPPSQPQMRRGQAAGQIGTAVASLFSTQRGALALGTDRGDAEDAPPGAPAEASRGLFCSPFSLPGRGLQRRSILEGRCAAWPRRHDRLDGQSFTIGMASPLHHPFAEVPSLIAIVAAILAAMGVTYLFLAYADTILGRIGLRGIDTATRIAGFFRRRHGHGPDLSRRGGGDPRLCPRRAALMGLAEGVIGWRSAEVCNGS
jgi:hypothetical protein